MLYQLYKCPFHFGKFSIVVIVFSIIEIVSSKLSNFKSCAETIDRMINFYEVGDQSQIKYLIASLLKLVVSQRLIKNKKGSLSLVPEVMVVDNVVSGLIRKEKLTTSEIEDAIQSSSNNGSIGLINSLAKLFTDDIITLDQAKAQIEEKNIEVLNRTIRQMQLEKEEKDNKIVY